MFVKLSKLYNTLQTIETKGDGTKAMADCLRFIEQMLIEEQNKQKTDSTETSQEEG